MPAQVHVKENAQRVPAAARVRCRNVLCSGYMNVPINRTIGGAISKVIVSSHKHHSKNFAAPYPSENIALSLRFDVWFDITQGLTLHKIHFAVGWFPEFGNNIFLHHRMQLRADRVFHVGAIISQILERKLHKLQNLSFPSRSSAKKTGFCVP